MIIGMHWDFTSNFATQNFDSSIGNNFIGIHIRRCSRASLIHIDNEIVIKFSFDDLIGCFNDCLSNLFVQYTESHVCLSSNSLNNPQCPNEFTGHSIATDEEIFISPLCLGTIICCFWDFYFTKRISFNSVLFHKLFLF